MSSDADLLFVVLAAKLGFTPPVTPDRAAQLEETLAPAQRVAVRAAVAAHLAMAGGDYTRALDSLRTAATSRPSSGVRPMMTGGSLRFRLGAEIGRDATGRVVEAFDPELKRDVAVKIMREDLPSEQRERFLHEAELLARLEHPNILPVHELAGREGRAPMIVAKRLAGRSLAALIDGLAAGRESAEAWPVARRLGVIQQICLGVAFAHARGVVHGNLGAAGVMIGDFGETLLVDWSGARERADDDGGADVAALGAILCDFVTLRPPPLGGSVEPPELDALLRRALARGPDGFRSARELHDAVAAFLATPPGPAPKKAPQARKGRAKGSGRRS